VVAELAPLVDGAGYVGMHQFGIHEAPLLSPPPSPPPPTAPLPPPPSARDAPAAVIAGDGNVADEVAARFHAAVRPSGCVSLHYRRPTWVPLLDHLFAHSRCSRWSATSVAGLWQWRRRC